METPQPNGHRWFVTRDDRRPPEAFVRRLAAFDLDLRVRWSVPDQCWLLERKLRNGRDVGPVPEGPGYHDRAVRHTDGYVNVASLPGCVVLDDWLFTRLRVNDLWSQGGSDAVCDRLDAEDEAEEETGRRRRRAHFRARSGDVYDELCWGQGRRVGMAMHDQDPEAQSRPGVKFVKSYG